MEDLGRAAIEEFRKLVVQRFSANFECVRAAAAPLPPATDDDALRDGIVEAVVGCLYLHAVSPLKRHADNRKAMLRVGKRAETAEAAMQALSASLDELFPWSQDLLFEHFKLATGDDINALLATIAPLAALARIAGKHEALLRTADRGGRPKMLAFEVLIRRLAEAYTSATGRAAAVNFDPYRDRYVGPFIRLVDALLPTVEALAAASGRPLERPAKNNARGQLIKALLRRTRIR